MPDSKARTKFVDQLADRLAADVRTLPSGAKSLAHLLVVVPTAQSGRRLRLALARRFEGGLISPLVRMPAQVLGETEDAVAGRADEIVAFWEAMGAKGSIELAAMMSDIRAILGANALTFSDVASQVGELLEGDLADVEVERWQKLAETEQGYYAALARRGKTDRIVSVQKQLSSPTRPDGVERIVVAGVLDPVPVMKKALAALALPVEEILPDDTSATLARSQIVASGTAAAEADKVAEIFARVKDHEAWPSLCLADAQMFPEIRSALQARGIAVHDPSRTALATSSLGRLVAQIAELLRTGSYSVFSSFLRTGDVRRWLSAELHLSEEEMSNVLIDLDNRQAELLPERVADIAPKTKGKLRAIFEFVLLQLRKKGVRAILESIFRGHPLDERDPDAREFAAAAETVNELLEECFDPSVPEAIRRELFAKRIGEATYSLEPDEGEVVMTDGWLEIPYLEADELLVVGFNEGVVPEAVVGHPFLPDALRRKLGLPDNESRTARDRRILSLALAGRDPAAVTFFFHNLDAAGDVKKPSRLLFETDDNADLIARVRRFYGLRAGTAEDRAFELPESWKLALPVPPAHEELLTLSPTRLDRYLKCPFTYYLSRKDIIGDKRMNDRAEELESYEYGNLAHQALEDWGRTELKDSDDAETIAAFLEERVDALLAERFGTAIPSIVGLQGESVKRRLRHFASVQAARRRAGWTVVAVEEKLEIRYGHTLFKGKSDRIDYNPTTDAWCVIDYKTWDKAEKEKTETYDAKKGVWRSLQLAFYCAMLDLCDREPFAAAKRDQIEACYCILGKTEEDVLFSEPMNGGFVPSAEKEIGRLMKRLEAGVFWPPSSKDEWQWDYKDWLLPRPEESVSAAWIADQEARVIRADEAEQKEVAE